MTRQETEELNSTLIGDRVSSIAARIELLAYRTSLDLDKHTGEVPINTSLFPEEEFDYTLEAMKNAFRAELCISDLIAIAFERERLGTVTVPQGKVGLATVSSIAISGVLLKAGIPLDYKFGGVLQIRNYKPFRFVELIEYASCSLDPAEIFIASKMTRVGEVARGGDGKILANFRELPAPCRPMAEVVVEKLNKAGFGGLVIMGEISEPICEIPVGLNRIGLVLQSGLNPVAAAMEAGIEVVNHAMSGVIAYEKLRSFRDL